MPAPGLVLERPARASPAGGPPRRRVSRAEWAVLAALATWGLFPLLLLLIHAAALHARFTGADGLIGADGVLGADQLQYLAWARDAAAHGGLASDLFSFAPSGHVYLEPVLAITGAGHALGLSLPLAYLLWKPVAILVMFGAALAWARRLCGGRPAAGLAVLVLSLFLYTPLDALVSWARLGRGGFAFPLYLLGSELLAAGKLWGYVPSALGLALVPVSLLALERALDPPPGAPPPPRATPAAVRLRPLILAITAALFASWLHPWQGITLVLIFVGLALVRRLAQAPALAAAAAGAGLPLVYYAVLSHADPAWRLAGHYEVIARFPALVLLAGLAPLVVPALFGVRRPRGVLIEQALLLWIAAALITYFANDSFAPHALQGLSLPLAVLIVRGWRRLRLAPGPSLVLGVVAVAALTLPGLAFDARKFVRTADGHAVQYYLPAGDVRALSWIDRHAPPGGVLAPTPFAAAVPGQTGRPVWTGHGYWSADYPVQAREVDRLFGGRLAPPAARRFVAATGARILVSDCAHHRDLSAPLRPLLAATRRFGCARVYVVRSARR